MRLALVTRTAAGRWNCIASPLMLMLAVGCSQPAHLAGYSLGEIPDPTESESAIETIPPVETSWLQVSAGTFNGCGLLSTGRLACWGFEGDGIVAAPQDRDFVQVRVATEHACALHATGEVTCWGCWRTTFGTEQCTPPSSVVFRSLESAGFVGCGDDLDGELHCWGALRFADVPPWEGVPHVAYDTSERATCIVRADNLQADCWSDLASSHYDVPAAPPVALVQVVVGEEGNCGLTTDGRAICWGDGMSTPPSDTFVQIDSYDYDSCGMRADGTLACWGTYFTEPGDMQYEPTPSIAFRQFSVGEDFACGIGAEDGEIHCWGGLRKDFWGRWPTLAEAIEETEGTPTESSP